MLFYLNFNVIDNILFKLSDRIWDTILFIYLHNNPYIKTHNLLEKRQPLYNYMIYTSQLCLDLMKLNCIAPITFRVIANASVTGL